jgi:hypothetical protein
MSVFYELKNVPVNSVLLLSNRQEALGFPRGDVILSFCQSCGFISNAAFNPKLLEYSNRYEATQGFSTTFNAYHQNLASRLIERYDLHHKNIIEIGCGQGEFLTLLCKLGENRGIGFDPVYSDERHPSEVKQELTFIKDFYSENYAHFRSDFVCCKMTLEHIQHTANFVGMVRRSIGDQLNTLVCFQVPDTTRILRELAFWDIYYEHCSYFTAGSLLRLFRGCGFEVVDLSKEYDDQYLTIIARPGHSEKTFLAQEDDLEILSQDIAYFTANCHHKLEAWRQKLQEINQTGRRAVIWGASSKTVAFLTTLNVQAEIEYAVDINPYKHGTYIAGTGQQIVAPEFLRDYQPDIVIVMNPIYCDEIERSLNTVEVKAEIIPI